MIRKVQIKHLFLYAPDDNASGINAGVGYEYEPHVVRELEKWLPTARGFMDVGANYGVHTVIACCINPNIPVFSVEVSRNNVDLLCRTVYENNLTNVTVLPFAVADRARIVHTNGNTSNTACSHVGDFAEFSILYQALPLDILDLPPIDLVKIDIEGFEWLAWQGMSKVFKNRPRMIFEFMPEHEERSCVTPFMQLQWLFDRGYRLTVLDYVPGTRKTFNEPEPIIEYVKHVSKCITDIIAEPL